MSRGNQQLLENAIQLHQTGRLVEAQAQYRKVLQHEPKNVDALNLLGVISSQMGDHKAAIELIGRAIAIKRNVPDYHLNYGEACRAAGRMAEAVGAYRKTIELGGADAQVYFALGCALESAKRMQEAADAFRQSLRLKPLDAAYGRLGFALQSLGRDEEAIAEYDRAIRAGANAEIYNNKGVALGQMGKYQEAEALYDKALSLDVNHADSHFNRSSIRLLKGDYAGGWPEYEWRWKLKEYDNLRRPYGRPRGDGGDLAGKTILVHAEQGVGDSIQFIRYASVLASRGARVAVEILEPLRMLAQRVTGVDKVIAMGEALPPFDVEAPLASLPMLCGTTLQNIPAQMPYITADPVIAETWRNRLAGLGGRLKVGLVWAGNPKHTNDRNRSMSLMTLAPLAQAGDITFISLQKGPQELAGQQPPDGMRCLDFAGELKDFSQTAGLIANLDLVISVDTSVAHLAGAMGRPVWTLLPLAPDWRWLLERDDSPWYPTMRLFRQTTRRDWTSVIGRVTGELKQLATGAGGTPEKICPDGDKPKSTREMLLCRESSMSESLTSAAPLRLNLGSGQNPVAGFINVDRSGSPDVKCDLEVFPWPWPDNSVGEVTLNHVLEHLGESVPTFFGIIKELYRVCRHSAVIHITVPHPRHDDFLGDPTHVRAFTPESFNLYNKTLNREWQKNRAANSPLGLYLDVDFVISRLDMELDEPWGSQLRTGKLTTEQAGQMIRQYNNVVKQIRVEWVVNKPA